MDYTTEQITLNLHILKLNSAFESMQLVVTEKYGAEDFLIQELIEDCIRLDQSEWHAWLMVTFKLSGVVESFYRRSRKLQSRVYFVDGLQHGTSEEWNENGLLRGKENFYEGKKFGYSEFYFDNGVPMLRRQYKNGELDGMLQRWDRMGQYIVEDYFKDDKLIYSKKFTPREKYLYAQVGGE